jgi:hypothetical protein
MKTLIVVLIGAIFSAGAALANEDSACAVASHLVSVDFPLRKVAAAITDKQLNVDVIGTASSSLGEPAGVKSAYPARLEVALAHLLPGVAVKVTAYTKPRETAGQMEKDFPRILSADKPSLVVWQTGTVEAMRRTDIDEFSTTLDEGIDAIRARNSDVILINMQYSPRTDSLISVTPYAEAMRFVALQHEIPLFDRFAVMKHWGEMGTFDLNEATKKIDTAARVHDCIARLLGTLIVEAARAPKFSQQGSR